MHKKKNPITRLKWLFYHHVSHKDYYRWAEPFVVREYNQQIENKLGETPCDIIFCAENALLSPYLKTSKPVIIWTDAPLAALIDFYPYMSNLCRETRKNIISLEEKAFFKSEKIIFSSNWAADFAIKKYRINPNKIHVFPWGANLKTQPQKEMIYQEINLRSRSLPIKLLFIGKEWERNGGSKALEMTRLLNSKGLPTELTVIGCKPIQGNNIPHFLKVLGYIDKNQKSGWEEISRIMLQSHFLLLLSEAETYGQVLCEANAFGIPCLTTDVGGFSSVIENGVNGQRFSINSSPEECCKYISELALNPEKYESIAISTLNEYSHRLNWETTAEKVKVLIEEI